MSFYSVRTLRSTFVITLVLLGLLGLLDLLPQAQAQNDATAKTRKTTGTIARATDFSIPDAPAFALLDVSPANVHTPAYPRDFKVDWVVNGDQIASNLAIQTAPVWIFGFENVSASEYRKLNPVVRQLSSLDLSVATTQQANDRFFAAAAKLNLCNAADPLGDSTYTKKLSNALRFSEKQTRVQSKIVKASLQTRSSVSGQDSTAQQKAITALTDAAVKFGPFKPDEITAYDTLRSESKKPLRSFVSELTQLHESLQGVSDAVEQRVRRIKHQYEREHWNAFRLDVAGGQVLEYDASQADSLLATSNGWGGWVTGAWGFGTDRFLASGMARVITADTTPDSNVNSGDNQTRYFAGVSLRYRIGSSLNHAIVEYIRRFGARPARHEIAYGGSIDLTDQVNVQFSVRTSYDDVPSLRDFRPTIKVNGKISDLLDAL